MLNKSLIIILLVIIVVFCMALYALLMQVFGIDNTNKAAIISGVLGMVGGALGALGAYLVAMYQINKQFEHDKKKEERQIKELLEQTLKKLEFLNIEAMEFVEYFHEEFAEPYDEERAVLLKFREHDLKWIVDNVNGINHEILKENYDLDYLNFSRVLNNMYLDVYGIEFLPEEKKPHNIIRLRQSLLKRKETLKSFDKYVKEHIKDIQKQLEEMN